MELNEILKISGVILLIVVLAKLSKKIIYSIFVLSLSVIAFFLVTGCSSSGNLNSSNLESVPDITITRIKDIPFLPNSKINIEKSLIMGEGQSWTGQLLVEVKENKRDVFNFYVKNLGDYSWKEQTTIRGDTSVLTYLGEQNRVAIITITETGVFDNATVLISVSPFVEAFTEKVGDYINEKYLEITE